MEGRIAHSKKRKFIYFLYCSPERGQVGVCAPAEEEAGLGSSASSPPKSNSSCKHPPKPHNQSYLVGWVFEMQKECRNGIRDEEKTKKCLHPPRTWVVSCPPFCLSWLSVFSSASFSMWQGMCLVVCINQGLLFYEITNLHLWPNRFPNWFMLNRFGQIGSAVSV